MAATLSIDFYVPVDQVAEPWRVEWHYGSNVATIACLQPMMEWLEKVYVEPQAPISVVVELLERMGRTKAQQFIGGE